MLVVGYSGMKKGVSILKSALVARITMVVLRITFKKPSGVPRLCGKGFNEYGISSSRSRSSSKFETLPAAQKRDHSVLCTDVPDVSD